MSFPLIVYYGSGKGKSTSALGCALRAVGQSMPVLLVQFIKKPQVSGEQRIIADIGIDFHCAGKGFVYESMSKDQKALHEQSALEGIRFSEEYLAQHDPGLVIFDELLHAYEVFPLLREQMLQLLAQATETCPTIVTGKDIPHEIGDIATYIYRLDDEKEPQDMLCIKGFHY